MTRRDLMLYLIGMLLCAMLAVTLILAPFYERLRYLGGRDDYMVLLKIWGGFIIFTCFGICTAFLVWRKKHAGKTLGQLGKWNGYLLFPLSILVITPTLAVIPTIGLTLAYEPEKLGQRIIGLYLFYWLFAVIPTFIGNAVILFFLRRKAVSE